MTDVATTGDQFGTWPERHDGADMVADPVGVAREFVAERFPDARAVYLAGSVATGRATASSDLDIVIMQRDDEAETFRETLRYDGWLVELFTHTSVRCQQFWDADVASRRCSVPQMYAASVVLASRDDVAEARQAEAARLVEAGPPPLDAQAMETTRYLLTDALDDLADGKVIGVPGERS